MYRFEMELYAAGFARVAGVDEAGRGPLAGPVVAAAVILPRAGAPEGLRDSKLLTARRREALYRDLQACASIGVGLVSEQRIDEINIFQAARLAMKRAVEDLAERPDALLVDGMMKLELGLEERDVIDGDSLSASVAAASIVAKVTRDALMVAYAETYPGYGFERHKGYGTPQHFEALKLLGPSPIHRLSFAPLAPRQTRPVTRRPVRHLPSRPVVLASRP